MRLRCVCPSVCVALVACSAQLSSAQSNVFVFSPPQIVLAEDTCLDVLATKDAQPGLVTVHFGQSRVGVLANDGSGHLAPGTGSSTLPQPRAGALADVDGDGREDLYLMSSTNDRVDLLYRVGNAFIHSTSFNPGDAPLAGVSGDFNANGVPDLACALHNANQLAIIEPSETGALQAVLRYSMPSKPWDVAMGDLNGDGAEDVAVACYGGNAIGLVLNPTGGQIDGPIVRTITGPARPKAVTIADFDGDGRNDIARADSQTGRVVVLRAVDDAPTFTEAQSIYVGQDPGDLAVGDLDADGDIDMAVACGPSYRVTLLRNDGVGVFKEQEVPFAYRPGRIVMVDLDQDGLNDLVVADQQSETLAVLINETETLQVVCPGDTDGDLRVQLSDLQNLLFDLGQPAQAERGTDLNGDGFVNLADLNLLLFNFGAVCGEE